MPSLIPLGRFMHAVAKYIVCEAEESLARGKLPPLGTPVYTKDARRVGVLADIIGPVNKPFIIVKAEASPELEHGQTLYYRRVTRRRRGRQGKVGGRARGRGVRSRARRRGGKFGKTTPRSTR